MFADEGIDMPFALAGVGAPPTALSTALADAGEIVDVASTLLGMLPLEPPLLGGTLPLELPLTRPEDDDEPVTASAPRASGLLSMNAMVGPATMLPVNLSRALLLSGCVLFVT